MTVMKLTATEVSRRVLGTMRRSRKSTSDYRTDVDEVEIGSGAQVININFASYKYEDGYVR